MTPPLKFSLRLARRELRGGVRGFRIFLACLLLGVAAIAAIGQVRQAITAGLEAQGSALLGGDAQVSFTFRFAEAQEREWIEAQARRVSELVEFRSMASIEGPEGLETALTKVKAVDDLYPLIGAVRLEPDIALADALAGQDGAPGAVLEPILADRLGLKIGDRFNLGSAEFILSARLISFPDSASGGFGLAPHIIVLRRALDGSGLLSDGSLFDSHYRILLQQDANWDEIKADAEARFTNTGLRWRDAREAAPGIERFVTQLSAFLILVGLAGLAVGGVGIASAVRAYLGRKTEIIAVLRSMGADQSQIFWTYFLQIAALAALGIVAGLVLGASIPLALETLLVQFLPIPTEFAIYPAPLIEAALYGVFIVLLFTLWPLAALENIKPAALFRNASYAMRAIPQMQYLLVSAGVLAAFISLASWFNGSTELTFWTSLGVIASLGFLSLAAWALAFGADWARPLGRARPSLMWALGSLSSGKLNGGEATRPVMLALGLGLSVLAIIGQIDGNLRAAIARDLPNEAPAFFFVDIQKDQIDPVLVQFADNPAISQVDYAPILRGVITQINGQRAREVAGDHWVLRGDRGVTYAARPSERTTITEGTWWDEDYAGPPQISFALEEAEELGLSLGDKLTVNILGRDIEAEITSFRLVDFSTAGIGFVMTMNPSALAGAPHSFIATVYAGPEAEAPILRSIAKAFPNITAVPMREAIGRVAVLLSGIASAISYAAILTLLTGFLVLIGAASANEGAQVYEAAVLRANGATRGQVLWSFALRSMISGIGAALVALLVGIIGSWAVIVFVMESDYTIIWSSVLTILGGGVFFTLGANLAFVWRPLAARPATVLRQLE